MNSDQHLYRPSETAWVNLSGSAGNILVLGLFNSLFLLFFLGVLAVWAVLAAPEYLATCPCKVSTPFLYGQLFFPEPVPLNILAIWSAVFAVCIGLEALSTIAISLLRFGNELSLGQKFQLAGAWGVRALMKNGVGMCLVLALLAVSFAQVMYTLLAIAFLILSVWANGADWRGHPTCIPLHTELSYTLRSIFEVVFVGIVVYLVLFGMALTAWLFSGSLISECDCSKIHTVKANMHTVQTMVETYAVDWNGHYPATVEQLYLQANSSESHYWKALVNPFTLKNTEQQLGHGLRNYRDLPILALPTLVAENNVPAVILGIPLDLGGQLLREPGLVLYQAAVKNYFLYGLDQNGNLIRDKGRPFVLSNS